jgi:beta-D-xylosidase 4
MIKHLDLPNVHAILWVGYPGQDGGTAVMNIIAGYTAPSGRLPITMYPTAYIDKAPMTNMNLRPSGSYPGRTYQWYKSPVLAFGYGLHYTRFSVAFGDFPGSFSIRDLLSGCKEQYLDLCPFAAVPILVENLGQRNSDYVALGFLTGEYGPSPDPIKVLATYKRVAKIDGGQRHGAELTWNVGNLARVDEKGNRILYPGTYQFLIDEPAIANITFTLTGRETILDKWPQN